MDFPTEWTTSLVERYEHFDLYDVTKDNQPEGLALRFREKSRCVQHRERLTTAACIGMLQVKDTYMLNSDFLLLCEHGVLVAQQLEGNSGEEIQLPDLAGLAMELLRTLKVLHSKRIFGVTIDVNTVVIAPDSNSGLRLFDFHSTSGDDRSDKSEDLRQAGTFLFSMSILRRVELPQDSEAMKTKVLQETRHYNPTWGEFLVSVIEGRSPPTVLMDRLENKGLMSYATLEQPNLTRRENELSLVQEWVAHGCLEAATRELQALLDRAQEQHTRLTVSVSSPGLNCCLCSESAVRKQLHRLMCLHYLCRPCFQRLLPQHPAVCPQCNANIELQRREKLALHPEFQEPYSVYEWQLAP